MFKKTPLLPRGTKSQVFSNISNVKFCFLNIQHKSKHSQKYSSVKEEIIWTYSEKNVIPGSSGEKSRLVYGLQGAQVS